MLKSQLTEIKSMPDNLLNIMRQVCRQCRLVKNPKEASQLNGIGHAISNLQDKKLQQKIKSLLKKELKIVKF